MKGELLKGHLDFLILAVLELRPAHGYLIIEKLRSRSAGIFNLPEGTIYPALHRLEHAGLLDSYWSDKEGRRRCVYRLTRRGRRMLAKQRRTWLDFSQAVTAVLRPAL